VRDAAGELAERLHLLRLVELQLERPVLGDVGEPAEEARLLPLPLRRDASVRAEPPPAAFPRLHAVLQLELRASPDRVTDRLPYLVGIVGVHAREEILARDGGRAGRQTEQIRQRARQHDDVRVELAVRHARARHRHGELHVVFMVAERLGLVHELRDEARVLVRHADLRAERHGDPLVHLRERVAADLFDEREPAVDTGGRRDGGQQEGMHRWMPRGE
jgi:hypothetical protein